MLTAILTGVSVAAVAYLIFYNTPGFGELGSATAAILLAVMAGTGYAWQQGFIDPSSLQKTEEGQGQPEKRPFEDVSRVHKAAEVPDDHTPMAECLKVDKDAKRLKCFDKAVPKTISMVQELADKGPSRGGNGQPDSNEIDCDVSQWNYEQYNDENIKIQGETSCAKGEIRFRLYDAKTDELVGVGWDNIKGYIFETYLSGQAPDRATLKYSVYRE